MKEEKRKKTFIKILQYIKPYSFFLAASVLFAVLTVVLTLYIPILTGEAIDYVVGEGQVDFVKIAEIMKVTDLGSEYCVFQPYGNVFADAEEVIVTKSFRRGSTSFEKGDIYPVEVITEDDEGVFTEVVINIPNGGSFTIQGVQDFSGFFTEYNEEEVVSKSTGFNKGDVVKVTDSQYYSQSVNVGDVAKVEGVDSDGDLVLKFIGDGILDGLEQYTDGRDIKLLVKAPEVVPKFEVGDIVTIKNDDIFNDKVTVGDKAVITGREYTLLMLTGVHKGRQQVCFGDEDYASKFLELVRN